MNNFEICKEDIKQAKKIIKYFKREKTNEEIFYNICFCILVPQAKFSSILKIVDLLKQKQFYLQDIPKEQLTELIKQSRFKNRKTAYLLEMRSKFDEIVKNIRIALEFPKDSQLIRKWLISNIKGISFKASSHLLRNLGIQNLAIIDTHILKYFSLTKNDHWNYEVVEYKLQNIAKEYKITLAVLDAIIWKKYSKTDWKDFVY